MTDQPRMRRIIKLEYRFFAATTILSSAEPSLGDLWEACLGQKPENAFCPFTFAPQPESVQANARPKRCFVCKSFHFNLLLSTCFSEC